MYIFFRLVWLAVQAAVALGTEMQAAQDTQVV
jgi:hypothetical protein